jgi:hypothetical protein
VRWHGKDAEQNDNYAQHPHQRHPKYSSSEESDHGHTRHTDGRHDHDQDDTYAPVQPPQPSSLVEGFSGSNFVITLTTDDVNLNGSLTQAAFKNWGELCLSSQPTVPYNLNH